MFHGSDGWREVAAVGRHGALGRRGQGVFSESGEVEIWVGSTIGQRVHLLQLCAESTVYTLATRIYVPPIRRDSSSFDHCLGGL